MITSNPPTARPAGVADDSGDGLLMFLMFTAAVLISTGAVVLIAVVGTWWILGFGFGIHVILTVVVMLTIVHVMTGRARAIADRDPHSSVPDSRLEARPQPRTRPVTAL
ncbi:MAG: hypothetical protein ACRDNK_17800 [Solirubrobacteraceae bacterium]